MTYEIIMQDLASIGDLVPIMIECQNDSASPDHEALPEMFDDLSKRDRNCRDEKCLLS